MGAVLLSSFGLSAQPRTVQPNLPPERVRTMAEWEEVEALVVSWRSYPAILTEVVRHAVRECSVYIIANDPLAVRIQLLSAGVPLDAVSFVPAAFNTVWMRDYGPWTVYQDDVGIRGISDYRYNRLHRTDDDLVPYEIADYLSLPLFNADETPYQWIHTGGNFLPDGQGIAYSSDLVLRENSGKTGLEISRWADVFFGIHDYRIVNRLLYDTIHHLDMHLRLLDEETIAVGTYPEGVADGPWIEDNIRHLQHHYRTQSGNPYRILRLQMPPQNGQYPPVGDYRTYTNSVFINGTILVPTYETQYDTTALRLYRDYYPGYNVVGINCNDMISALGALHCITQLVGVEHPLWIAHDRLRDTYTTDAAYPVAARLRHSSGIASADLYYRIWPDTAYQRQPMQPDPTDAQRWTANIPAQPLGTRIQYYLAAAATSGKVQHRPLPAPEAYHEFSIKNWDTVPQADWLQANAVVAPGTAIRFTDVSEGGQGRVWSFPGGEPVWGSGQNMAVAYPQAGEFSVRLVSQNPLGADTLLRQNAVQVLPAQGPSAEDFSTSQPTVWQIVPAGSEPLAWQWQPDSGCQGGCLALPCRQSPRKLSRAYLRTAIDLREYDQAQLELDVAYAPRDDQHFDELRMYLVDAQGARHNIFNKGGHVLATVPGYLPDFAPTTCAHWRTERIGLSAWEGTQVLLEIEGISDRGNSIHIDNVRLVANALPQAEIAWPAANTLYTGAGHPLTATMRVAAADPDGTITQVDFFLNSLWLGQSTQPPFEQDFTLPAWGEYTLRARVRDDSGAEAWALPVQVRYDFQSGTAAAPAELPFSIAVSPNPSAGDARLTIVAEGYFSPVDLILTDSSGQGVWQDQIALLPGTTYHSFPLAHLPAGLYYLSVRHGTAKAQLEIVRVK